METLTPEELDAVNEMLVAIGETEIASYEDDVVEATSALARLRRNSKRIQRKGWWFNTVYDVTLDADQDGEVALPSNNLAVFPDSAAGTYLVERAGKLFDAYSNTYTISRDVQAKLVNEIDFSDLPLTARDYITAFSVRDFHAAENGDATIRDNLMRNERAAWVEFKKEHNQHRGRTMIDATMASALSRRYSVYGPADGTS